MGKTKPRQTRFKAKQRKLKRHNKNRDDLQDMGVLPVTPDGAVKSEVVDPRSQGEQLIVDIPLDAARHNWATPGHKKGKVVDALVSIAENDEVKAFDRVLAVNALGKLDQMEWERQHPEEAGKAKGGVKVEQSVNVVGSISAVLAAVDEQERCKSIESKLEVAGNGKSTDQSPAPVSVEGTVVASCDVLRPAGGADPIERGE